MDEQLTKLRERFDRLLKDGLVLAYICSSCGGRGMDGEHKCLRCIGTGLVDWKLEKMAAFIEKEVTAAYLLGRKERSYCCKYQTVMDRDWCDFCLNEKRTITQLTEKQ